MSPEINDLMCKAVDAAEKGVEFYQAALQGCTDGLGREVFEALLAEEKENLELIKSVLDGLEKGGDFASTCNLEEEEESDAKSLFASLAEKYDPAACVTQLGAVKAGIELKQGAVALYQNWLRTAHDATQRMFVNRLLGEQQRQSILLKDLEFYYEDPEGWALEKSGGGLDGA